MTDTEREKKAREFWLGRIATFQPDPKRPTRFAGQIVRVDFAGYQDPNRVPNFTLTVRGRTGKVATVDLLTQRTSIHETWPQALEEIK